MTYHQLDTLLQRTNRYRRKLAHNTYAFRLTDSTLVIRLHGNTILTYRPDNSVTYTTCGWYTSTTKSRMNQFGPLHIYQRDFFWFYDDDQPYHDGLTVTNGQVRPPVEPA